MNLKNYIASGVLELYIFDVLTEEEKHSVEKNIERFSEVREEIKDIENALLVFSFANSMPAPPSAKKEILASIDQLID